MDHFLDRAGHRNCELLIAECGLKKKIPKSEIRNSKSEMGRPTLFAHDGLASGPQARFSVEEKGIKAKGGKAQIPLTHNRLILYDQPTPKRVPYQLARKKPWRKPKARWCNSSFRVLPAMSGWPIFGDGARRFIIPTVSEHPLVFEGHGFPPGRRERHLFGHRRRRCHTTKNWPGDRQKRINT